jgi:hypothetical protein
MTTPEARDPFRSDPPQTLPFHPHDQMKYMGVIYGREYVACTNPECNELVIFEKAAEHQASHLSDPLARLAAIAMQLKMLQLRVAETIEQELDPEDSLAATYRMLNSDLFATFTKQLTYLELEIKDRGQA